jgi:ABC-type arginine transport system permease subunit
MKVAELLDTRMSARARFYLWATAVPALVVSLFCFFGGQLLRAPSYSVIRTVGFNTFAYWGFLYGVVAVTAAWAAIRGHETLARFALIASAFGMACWAAGFGIAYHTHHLAGPTGVLVWGTLAVKDLTVCRQPLRSPFEAITRAFATQG